MAHPSINKIINALNTSLFSSPPQDLVFSYTLNKAVTPTGFTLMVQQMEANFSLSLAVQEKQGQLIVTSFTLVDNKQLEQESLALYDAAMLEIALQGLELVFLIAQKAQLQEIAVVLAKHEADHLSSFYSFFHTPSFHGNQAFLILPTTENTYNEFIEKTTPLKTKIRTELWKWQRQDSVVQSYLQSHPKGTLFLGETDDLEPQSSLEYGKVIAFPFMTKQAARI